MEREEQETTQALSGEWDELKERAGGNRKRRAREAETQRGGNDGQGTRGKKINSIDVKQEQAAG